jgi:hypothetical protein
MYVYVACLIEADEGDRCGPLAVFSTLEQAEDYIASGGPVRRYRPSAMAVEIFRVDGGEPG